VTLGLLPHRALVNDVNPHLINFYSWLQRGLTIDLVMKKSKRLYYRYRRRFNNLLDQDQATSLEAASLFYYLNRTGYNGLCRFNQKGGFNVPYGKYRRINYDSDFTRYKPTFEKWRFSNQDFQSLPLEPGDFVYADPPYDVEFTSYSKGGFSWEDQKRVANWLAAHAGPVILSNQATDRIVRLYTDLGFHLEYLNAPRMISCTGDRTPAREVLALKNLQANDPARYRDRRRS